MQYRGAAWNLSWCSPPQANTAADSECCEPEPLRWYSLRWYSLRWYCCGRHYAGSCGLVGCGQGSDPFCRASGCSKRASWSHPTWDTRPPTAAREAKDAPTGWCWGVQSPQSGVGRLRALTQNEQFSLSARSPERQHAMPGSVCSLHST